MLAIIYHSGIGKVMKTSCPHCTQGIGIDPETLASLQGSSHFECPACGGAVSVPILQGSLPVALLGDPETKTAPIYLSSRSTATAHLPAAHRGLNRNLRILGTTALLVLGGIAFMLASKKSGDTHNTNQNIRNEIINNSYFQNLIATGVTTMKDLDAIAEIRAYEDGFIGINAAAFGWNEARDLTARIGATILPIGNPTGGQDESLVSWMRKNFTSHLTSPVWVSSADTPHLCDATQTLPVSAATLASRHRVMLFWNPPKAPTQTMPTVEPASATGHAAFPLASAPEFSYTSEGSSVTVTGCKGATPEISIPASMAGMPVTTIGNNAFLYHPIIRRVIIPETVVSIESYAFFGCEKLARVQIPASVLQIGGRAFGGCGDLMAFDVASANSSFKVMDGVLYSKDGLTLWQYPGGKGGKFSIPPGVSKIGGWAFANSRLVEEIHVPAAITEIGADPFGSCGQLQRIEVASENPLFSSRDGVFYNKDATLILQYPGGRVGPFEIPAGVVGIDAVFAYAGKLTRVTIPASVSRLGDNAFFGCSNLSRVDFAGDAPQTIGKNIFQGSSAGFRVFFQPGAKGFTTPTWNGYACSESPEPMSLPARSATTGRLPWADRTGKIIHAEFIRLDGESVVIRKDGKQFYIPLAKLSAESRQQALELGGKTIPDRK